MNVAPGVAEIWLSRAAFTDLTEIDEYSAAQFGDAAADAYKNGLDQAFTRLASFPRSAEVRPAYGDGIRCLNYGRHRILYLIDGEIVQIVRVLHQAQDVLRNLAQ
ncbi:MAG: type II toxin-antitoxin system RelE/ParE family toxin [Novosphingobium sp.]